MKLTRRFLALLLAFSMSLSMVTPAFASEAETVAETEPVVVIEETEAAAVIETEAETVTEAAVVETEAESATEAAVLSEEPSNVYTPTWGWNSKGTKAAAFVTLTAGTNYIAIPYANVHVFQSGRDLGVVNGTEEEPALFEFTIDFECNMIFELYVDGYENIKEPGSSYDNPYYPEWDWNEDGTEATASVEVCGDICIAITEANVELFWNDWNFGTYSGTPESPAIFMYGHGGAEVLELKLVKVAPEDPTDPSDPSGPVEDDGYINADNGYDWSNPFYFDWDWNVDKTEATASVTLAPQTEVIFAIPYTGTLVVNDSVTHEITGTEAEPYMSTLQSYANEWSVSLKLTVAAQEPEAPAEGSTPENPIDLTALWQMNDAQTEATYTVTLAPGTTYFMSYVGGGMELTINGGEPTLLTGMPRQPVYFDITNNGAAEAEYTLMLAMPMGSRENPEIVWNPTNFTATLSEGDFDGHYYTFTNRYMTGTLVFTPSAAEGIVFDMNITNMTTGITYWLVDSTDGTLAVDIKPGDTLIFQLGTIEDAEGNWYPAAEINVTAEIVYPLGSMEKPDALPIDADFGEETQTVLTLEAGNNQGYFYTWTAPAAGDLTVTMLNSKAGWSYVLNNLTSCIYGESSYSCNGDAASATISVNAGDEIQLIVNSCGTDMATIPGGDVYFTTQYTMAPGTVGNPLAPEWIWNEEDGTGTATFTAPAGTTYYNITVSGMLVVNDEEPVAVNGNGWMPELRTFVNTSDAPVDVKLYLYTPVGTMDNPAKITEGTTTATVEAGTQGMFYSFIAPDKGTVTVTIGEATNGWQYVVNNVTAWQYGDSHWHDDDPVVNSEVISVNQGDELVISVNTYDPADMFAAPAGSVSFDITFEAGEGSELMPVMIYDASQYFFPVFQAYESICYSAFGIGGMEMAISDAEGLVLELNGETYYPENGVIYLSVPASMNPRMPVNFKITNESWETNGAVMNFWHPVGSMANPQYIQNLGKKLTADIAEGDQDGYTFGWTATGNGLLEVTINSKSGWSYQVINTATGASTEIHNFCDETVVKKDYVRVSTGDVVHIVLMTADPENMWSYPAGKVEFTPKLIVSYTESLLAGKNTTLKYLDATGKTVAAGKVEWTMAEEFEAYATLKNGKLTAAKTVTEPVTVVVIGEYEGVAQEFTVTIYPAVTSVDILNADGDTITGLTQYVYGNRGETLVIGATTHPASAQKDVQWSLSNVKKAGLAQNEYGQLIAVPITNAKGQQETGTVTYTATATDGSNKKASIKVTFINLVNWIEITSKTASMTVGSGKSLNLVANVNADASNKNVTWEIVDGADYATINAKTGKLDAKKGLLMGGYVTVKATALDEGAEVAYAEIYVAPLASKVVINDAPATFDMNIGWPAFYLSADVLDADEFPTGAGVTWKSSNAKIASIDEYGSVFCEKPGNVTFTATANDGSNKKATVKVTIVKSPSYIEMPFEMNYDSGNYEAAVAAGKTLDLKAVVYDADASNKKLTWTISENSIGAKVTNGKVSSNAKLVTEPTTVTVTATAQLADSWGEYATASCDVTIYPATTKVTVFNTGANTIRTTDTVVLYAESAPVAAAGVYNWKSSNEKIAVISENADGSVTVIPTGEKTGKVTITATAADGTNKNGKITITVVQAVESLELNPYMRVLGGKTLQLAKNVLINPANATNKKLTWSMTMADGTEVPKTIATLNANTGALTTKAVKEAVTLTITAKAQDGFGATVTGTVTICAKTEGVIIMDVEGIASGERYEDVTDNFLGVEKSNFLFAAIATNDPNAMNEYQFTVSNTKNFRIGTAFDEFGTRHVCVEQIPDANGKLTYGEVTLTAKAMDGSNKTAKLKLFFMDPSVDYVPAE